ncbi:MAG: hypothetical protein HQL32_03945 [Planctomycetes bacterium]|nr:hypothetical protein [Planctomycetota bacterium]
MSNTKGIVSIYVKPGCKGNARFKEALKTAGYNVQTTSIIDKKWEEPALKNFFGDQAIHDCVNERAPALTKGEIKVDQLSEEELLQAMIADPILIKRPLVFFRGRYACGMNNELVNELLYGDETTEEDKKVSACENDHCA